MHEKLASRAKETTRENSHYHFKAVDRRFKTKAEMNRVSDITKSQKRLMLEGFQCAFKLTGTRNSWSRLVMRP